MDEFFEFVPNVSGVKGMVYIGGKILVKRRDDKTDDHPLELDFPGGGADKNETPFETFRREAKEEFNIDLSTDDIIYARKYRSVKYPGTFTFFPVAKLPETEKSKIKLGKEGLEWILMDIKDYLEDEDTVDFLAIRAKEYIEDSRFSK